ncbi:MAG: hypothetical protein FWC20_02080 [Oscillospiraceae bacterium]|nr:hypothetical protein [Oscillospiraceae bacterium]MCL2278181.1 hypothetical protein [Oscillospiraceae bacterium]
MYNKKAGRAFIITLFIISLLIMGAGVFGLQFFMGETNAYRLSALESETVFMMRVAEPFRNTAADAPPFSRDDDEAVPPLYYFETPEGFTMLSHSAAWNTQMLIALYEELMLNQHGEEIHFLHEVIVFADEDERALASYVIGSDTDRFTIEFSAIPSDFGVNFGRSFGTIHLYGGDTITTIEGMAGSLSHEYGHLFTFYHMFNDALQAGESLANTEFARLREASRHDFIVSAGRGEDYWDQRFRYLFEIAAEDFVQLMGSPTTRQVVDFVDVRQRLNTAEPPTNTLGARNAFPQENLMIPLANDVPGLKEYFFSFINREPPRPIEQKREIRLEITQHARLFDLVTGERTFLFYEITWNTPYDGAVYTLVTYDPANYVGWGVPVRTVRPGITPSAIVGEYVIENDGQVRFMNDNLAVGTRVFMVIALLPDGTFFASEKLTHTFTGVPIAPPITQQDGENGEETEENGDEQEEDEDTQGD